MKTIEVSSISECARTQSKVDRKVNSKNGGNSRTRNGGRDPVRSDAPEPRNGNQFMGVNVSDIFMAPTRVPRLPGKWIA